MLYGQDIESRFYLQLRVSVNIIDLYTAVRNADRHNTTQRTNNIAHDLHHHAQVEHVSCESSR